VTVKRDWRGACGGRCGQALWTSGGVGGGGLMMRAVWQKDGSGGDVGIVRVASHYENINGALSAGRFVAATVKSPVRNV